MINLRLKLARKRLSLFQLGDFYDQFLPSGRKVTTIDRVYEILLSHTSYKRIMAHFKSLSVHRLFGDADFGLRHCPGCWFSAREGKVYLEHGFTADYFVSGATAEETGELASGELHYIETIYANRAESDNGNGYVRFIPDDGSYSTRIVDHYKAVLGEARICVTGHTHSPNLLMNRDGHDRIFIDAGAWTKGRTDFAIITNEEVAICRYRM